MFARTLGVTSSTGTRPTRGRGAYANRLEAEVRAATNGSPSAFDLLIVEDGAYREAFPNLSMNPNDARYLGRILNDLATVVARDWGKRVELY